MSVFSNIITCNTANSNTGVPQCSFDFGLIEKVILVPKGTKFTQTEVQSLYTKLSGMAQGTAYAYPYTAAGSEQSRAYPIGKFIGIEDKSSETTINTTNYGSVVLGKKGQFHYVFEYKNGGMNYDVMLNTFESDQTAYDCLLLDKAKNAVIGTTPDYNTSGYVLQGLSLDLIYCPLPKISTGSEATKHYLGLVFTDANELLQSMAYFALPTSQRVGNIVGLRNFEMTTMGVTTPATGGGTTLKIRVTTDGGAVDLTATYGSAIAALYANFTVAKTSDGGATTYAISAGAYAPTTQTINFTIATLPATGTELIITSPTIAQLTSTVPGFGNSTYVFTTN